MTRRDGRDSGARADKPDARRRRVLQGLAGAGALALAGRDWLVREGAAAESQLNDLPRVALVIGNSRYKETPLHNPANDANALATQLKALKFNVTLQLDARRQEMVEAIRAYGASLAQSKAIGLFYFAGHGAQLAWRNYLIPVDAAVGTAEELIAQAVDMNALLDDLIRARNPMNIIILDACRDNPFGSQVALAQRGLSQLDAPVGTLLAYATAPGNVAADGVGENGLYTGFLLKEMQARDAKIEDVFKRVRLNVRRLSKGQQIPWESTSLEQDFYFYPAAAARKLSPEEQEKQFEEELEIWQRIRATSDPSQIEDYLRRFPSGKFSELAQFRLDRLLARQGEKAVGDPRRAAWPATQPYGFVRVAEPARVAVPSVNPYSRGTANANVDYQVGDSYSYVRMDAYSRVEEGRFQERVTEVTDFEVIYNRGRRITDLLGNDIVARGGAEFSPSQIFIYEYRVGKKWSTRFHVIKPEEGPRRGKGRKGGADGNREDDIELEFHVVGRESITVPAGTFDAFRVEGNGYLVHSGLTRRHVYWIAPDQVRRVLAMDFIAIGARGGARRVDRFELVAYQERRGGMAAA